MESKFEEHIQRVIEAIRAREEAKDSKQNLESFNQRIKEEIEKAVQAGKQDESALVKCAAMIEEYDSRLNKKAHPENKFEAEKLEQKAVIEVTFRINPEAEQTIKKKFEGSVLEDTEAEQIYIPVNAKFEVSGEKQLLVHEKADHFQVILKKGEEILADTKVDVDTNVRVFKSETQSDVFYFFGIKESSLLSCN